MSFRDDFFHEQTAFIQRFGWAVVHVLPADDDPEEAVAFAYTVGLTAAAHPELLIAGLPSDLGHQLINEIAGRIIEEGVRLQHGRHLPDLIAEQDVIVLQGTPTTDLWPGAALARYGRSRVRLQQLVWPSPANHFPWHSSYESADYPQPLIDAPPAGLLRCHAPRRLSGRNPRPTRSR
ncbi:DUF4262 domain-containing protein [Actinoplanes sp. NPDC051851]|uniref:DUF4262 domain-containing protein n=1 Tax=Actinoplanes sp. NPDC051851 TaxID=3154753 RepID=UPI003417838C